MISKKSLISKFFSSQDKSRVTFIGLGNMGYKMASNLLKSGKYNVSGYDLNKQVQENFNKLENTVNEPISESVKKSKFVITMLPNTDIVNNTWKEVISHKPSKGTFIIDSSTINPIESKKISLNAEKEGLNPADAPVSGGVNGALNGTLTFMVGCNKDKFETLNVFLSSMGKNIIHCGDYSTGQVVKVCNNLVLGITTAGLSEALVLGEKLGIDMQVLCKVMSVSSAACYSLNNNSPIPNFLPTTPSNRDYENGFNTELMSKDMLLALEISKNLNKSCKLGEVASGYYKELMDKGLNKKDFSIVYKHLLEKKL